MRAVSHKDKEENEDKSVKLHGYSLVGVTPKGINVLRQLNVKAVFDFRSDPEIERQGVMP